MLGAKFESNFRAKNRDMNASQKNNVRKKNGRVAPDTALSTDPLNPLPGIELFFGVVGPTGTDTDSVCKELADQLRKVGYSSEIISLSKMIIEFSGKNPPKNSEYNRIRFLMKEGRK
jgi:hypothetical protein